MNKWLLVLSFFTALPGFSQKAELTHEQYDEWKSLKNTGVSRSGRILFYETAPYRGDGFLSYKNLNGTDADTLVRGYDFQIGNNDLFFVAKIRPQFDTIRKLEIEKVKKEKLPKDTLWIHIPGQDTSFYLADLLDVKVSSFSDWLMYRTNSNELPLEKGKKKKKKRKKKGKERPDSKGKLVTLFNPITYEKEQILDVTDYHFSDSGSYISFVTHQKREGKDVYTLDVRNLKDPSKNQFFGPFTSVGRMVWNSGEGKFAFLASRDTVEKNKHFELFITDLETDQPQLVIDSLFRGMPKGHGPSEYGNLMFAEDADRLFFGTSPLPEREQKDTLTEDEKVKVDVWGWQDEEIQPQQLVSLKRKQKENFLSFYDWQTGKLGILESDSMQVVSFSKHRTGHFLLSSNERYRWESGWSFPWKNDYYFVRIEDTEPQLFLEGCTESLHLDPEGTKAVYFDSKKEEYMLHDFVADKTNCLTCGFDADWLEDNNGQPYKPTAINKVYWENSKTHLWLMAKHDLYRVRYNGTSYRNISIASEKSYPQNYEVIQWDKDSLYYDPHRVWIKSQDDKTKQEAIFTIDEQWNLVKRMEDNAALFGFNKSEESDVVTYRRSTVSEYPELWVTDVQFTNLKVVTHTNPQQKDYNWANVELIKWKTPSGKRLQGLLYTPENLDPKKKYPLLVYFYELNSDNLHRHWVPRPTASIIFPTEYASSGYVVFIPDIRYDAGNPAESAYDCIVSGTDYVLKKYPFTDSGRMGLQGQSWGGYQTAQLITMTNRYKAAMAGAPVANMFSAYGGIRWGSGFSRMFQYERTQSRIGGTIWEEPERYVENSPLFGLPNVKTPLLIMHNDNDGAVPWYQGIELFMGLRRLNKPVWLLNYNGDKHNLMKESNRRDLSIRMKQFFDHYLLNKPAPKWMVDGIPAIDKGKDDGLELVD